MADGIDALVLAGGRLETERFPDLDPARIPGKTAVPLLGKPMVWWVVNTLRQCSEIARIVVVGPGALRSPALDTLCATVVPERGSICENLRAGLDALPDSQRMLGISGDLPLITPAAIHDFLVNAPEADVVFPYVEREDIMRDFPDRKWVFARTPEGHLTGGAAFLCRPPALLEHWDWVETLLDARRQSVRGLLKLIGPSAAVKYACGRLHVRDVEARLSDLLHVTARGYHTRFPVLAMDVDKSADIPVAENILRKTGADSGTLSS